MDRRIQLADTRTLNPTRYLYGLVAAGCLATLFYASYQNAGDLTLAGWSTAMLGWGIAAVFLGQLKRAHDSWREGRC